MLKKHIKFNDYNGQEREDDYRFNLNDSELTKWLTTSGEYTLDKIVERLAKEKNGKKIMEIFEDLIHRSYGKMSLDGVRFEKSEEIWLDFYQTEAYSVLFMELVTDAKKAAEFVNGVVSKDVSSGVIKAIKENPDAVPEELKDYVSGLVE